MTATFVLFALCFVGSVAVVRAEEDMMDTMDGEEVSFFKSLSYAQPNCTISVKGASFVRPSFYAFELLEGDFVTVANSQGTEEYRYTTASFADSDSLSRNWATSVSGDRAVITLWTKRNASGAESAAVVLGNFRKGF